MFRPDACGSGQLGNDGLGIPKDDMMDVLYVHRVKTSSGPSRGTTASLVLRFN